MLCLKQMFSESSKRAWLQLYLLILTHLTLSTESPRKSWIFDYCSSESLSAKMPPQQDHKSSTMQSELFLPRKVWAAFICGAKQCHGARRAGRAQGQFFTCDINRAAALPWREEACVFWWISIDNDTDNGNSLTLWACTLSPSPVSFIAWRDQGIRQVWRLSFLN